MDALAFVCAVSRPYYWLVTLWLYLLPTGGRAELFGQLPFWLGFCYCTLPLNLMCYLMNDLADHLVDADNPRKGGMLLGAKAELLRLRAAVPHTAALQLDESLRSEIYMPRVADRLPSTARLRGQVAWRA